MVWRPWAGKRDNWELGLLDMQREVGIDKANRSRKESGDLGGQSPIGGETEVPNRRTERDIRVFLSVWRKGGETLGHGVVEERLPAEALLM